MIVRDEAENLPDCLASIQGQVDEIVIVDTGSRDGSIQIARRHGARVESMTWSGDFSVARNRSLSMARGSHMFIIDADELAPPNLRERIESFLSAHPRAFGRVQIRSPYRNASHSLHSSAWVSRLFPNMPEIEFFGAVHEQLRCQGSDLPRLNTDITLEHSGYNLSEQQTGQKYQRNKTLLEYAVQADPGNAYLWFQLGKTLQTVGRWPEAATAYERSWMIVQPDGAHKFNFTSDLLLGYLHALKHLQKADLFFPLMDVALDLYPDVPDLPFLLAGALMAFGIPDFDRIRRCYERCLSIGEQGHRLDTVEGTGSYLALYNLGVFYEALGDLPHARSAFAKAAQYAYQPAKLALKRVGLTI